MISQHLIPLSLIFEQQTGLILLFSIFLVAAGIEFGCRVCKFPCPMTVARRNVFQNYATFTKHLASINNEKHIID